MRKSKITTEKQEKLIEYFLLGSSARTAAELAGVNRNTATYYFQRLRELIFQYQEEHTMFSGEIEVDESYSVERPLGLEDIEKVREAVELGADIHAKDNDGKTPLHHAILGDRLEVIQCFIDLGADINARIDASVTSLHIAVQRSILKVVDALIQKGADVNAADKKGQTAFSYALKAKDEAFIQILLEAGAQASPEEKKRLHAMAQKPNSKLRLPEGF